MSATEKHKNPFASLPVVCGNCPFVLTIPRFPIQWVQDAGLQIQFLTMTNMNTGGDSWGQLLSDFGIEDKEQYAASLKETKTTEPMKTRERIASSTAPEPTGAGDFGAGLGISPPETAEESSPKEKKSLFSRFPKINFFGAPPHVSLDSVMEGAKSPSLGGKAFTDNKLEKMPLSHERTDRQTKQVPHHEPLSAVASQIDSLASGRDSQAENRPSQRIVSSIFDDPVPESEEARALKDLMGGQSVREESRRAPFLEEEPNSRRSGRGRRHPSPEDGEVRGRGARYKPEAAEDDLPSTDFETVDDRPVDHRRGRGRRGAKNDDRGYRDRERVQEDIPQEEWSEVDAALQADQSESRHRGGRYQRSDTRRRPERLERPERSERHVVDREPLDEDESGVVMVHGSIPSWDEAIGDIVAGNIARHKSNHSSRGRR